MIDQVHAAVGRPFTGAALAADPVNGTLHGMRQQSQYLQLAALVCGTRSRRISSDSTSERSQHRTGLGLPTGQTHPCPPALTEVNTMLFRILATPER